MNVNSKLATSWDWEPVPERRKATVTMYSTCAREAARMSILGRAPACIESSGCSYGAQHVQITNTTKFNWTSF